MAFALGLAASDVRAAPRKLIGHGWDTTAARTEDIYRDRAKFAATGLDGILVPVDGVGADGKRFRCSNMLSDWQGTRPQKWTDACFAQTREQLAAITKCRGLTESLGLVFLIPGKRIAWEDDAFWSLVEGNMRTYARTIRAGGLKGIALDQEDYYNARQFSQATDDPPGTVARARQRGRQFFGALFSEFPEAKVLGFWLFTNHENLWRPFLNGMLDVIPPTARIIDGNEDFGYWARADRDDFRNDHWYVSANLRDAAVAPENWAKYAAAISLSSGHYLDNYIFKPGEFGNYYMPPLDGSRLLRLEDNLASAVRYADDLVWIYGERGTFIDWSRKDDPKHRRKTWEEQLPGLARTLRLAAGDPAALDAEIAAGTLTNLVTNSGCDRQGTETTPKPYGTWTRLIKPDPSKIFAYEADDGCAKRGCLRLNGDGYYYVCVGGLKPGEPLYIRLAVKGDGWWGLTWKTKGKSHFFQDRRHVRADPEADRGDGWRTTFVRAVVPEGADGLQLSVTGYADRENPVLYDDIRIFRRK